MAGDNEAGADAGPAKIAASDTAFPSDSSVESAPACTYGTSSWAST